jgi:hypothetical protein
MYEIMLGDFIYDVLVTHFYPGCPAKLSGPPEDCYPEEASELEWEAATGNEEMDYLLNACSGAHEALIVQQLYDQILEEREDV